MSNKDNTAGVILGLGFLGFVGILVAVAITAFTIQTMWAWFIVPLGVKAIGMAHAYGLSLMCSVFLGIRGLPDSNKSMENLDLVAAILINAIALLFGFITVQFM